MENGSLRLVVLNEGQDLNYQEKFNDSIIALFVRCSEIIKGLSRVLTDGSFSIRIEEIKSEKKWFYQNGKFYNSEFIEIEFKSFKQLSANF